MVNDHGTAALTSCGWAAASGGDAGDRPGGPDLVENTGYAMIGRVVGRMLMSPSTSAAARPSRHDSPGDDYHHRDQTFGNAEHLPS